MIKILSNIILLLIQLIEKLEYINYKFLPDDNISDKIINTILVDNIFVESDSGMVPISCLHVTKPYIVYELKVKHDNGSSILECANTHILFSKDYQQVFVEDLNINDSIITKYGIGKVEYIKKKNISVSMADITVNNLNHRFYSNDILSHNTVTSATFLVWYLLFHSEKNALVVANVSDTTKEIIDKIKSIIKNLPFFLKPGIEVDNVMSIKFENGSRIIGRSTTKKTGIGFTIHLLYIDEFAHIDNTFLNYFYRAIYPTISSMPDSRIIITSTPNGTNKFYQLWRDAIEGKNTYFPIRVDYWQVPGRDEKWKRETIADLGSVEDFNQEYGLQFFSGDNLLLSSIDLKKMNVMKTKYETFNWHILDYGDKIGDFRSFFKFHPSFIKKALGERDDLKVNNDYFVLSIESADGVGKNYSVMNIFKLIARPIDILEKHKNTIKNELDVMGLIQVGTFRTNKLNIDKFCRSVTDIVFRFFNPDNICIALELNHKGEIIHRYLKNHPMYAPNIMLYTKHTVDARYYSPGIILNSNKSKVSECENFRYNVAIDRMIHTEYNTIDELGGFGRVGQGSIYRAQSGNDDLSITCIHANLFFTCPQFYEFAETVYDGMPDSYKQAIENDYIEYNRQIDGERNSGFLSNDYIDSF